MAIPSLSPMQDDEQTQLIEFWQFFSSRMQQDITSQQYALWIAPMQPASWLAAQQELTLFAANSTKLNFIRQQYLPRITRLAEEFFGQPVVLKLKVGKTDGVASSTPNATPSATQLTTPAYHASFAPQGQHTLTAPPTSPTSEKLSSMLDDAQLQQEAESLGVLMQEEAAQQQVKRSGLNTALTFDNFVMGKANQLAQSIGQHVKEHPGTDYNPLFIYGGVGLGKTHLMHAIGNGILQDNPRANIRYTHAEQYVSDLVKTYRNKTFDQFKNYYHSLDVLLIDDIQFFAGKERTQEGFFHTFEALVSTKKQIIITSDTYPQQLTDIDDRLVSRFSSGLTVAIEPPELEMRVAILLKKAEQENAALGDDEAFFIAKNLRANVRELEGALRKVIAYSRFQQRPISMELVKEALRELFSTQRGQITIELIQKVVADYYKINVSEMGSKNRPIKIAMPRQIAMYLCKELTPKSLPEIGQAFGGRDHTTVLHAVRKIIECRANDRELNHQLHVLEQTLKG